MAVHPPTPQQMLETFQYISQHVAELESKLNTMKMEMTIVATQLRSAQAIQDSVRDIACKPCQGQGKIREWYAQDDSRIVKCDVCDGTGFAFKWKDGIR